MWRLVFALMLVLAGTGLLFYVLMWILVPQEPVAYQPRVSANP